MHVADNRCLYKVWKWFIKLKHTVNKKYFICIKNMHAHYVASVVSDSLQPYGP